MKIQQKKFMFNECYIYIYMFIIIYIFSLIRYTDISRLLYQQYVCRTYEPVHIVAFSQPNESWQLNGESVSPEIRRLPVRFPSGAQKHFSEFAIKLEQQNSFPLIYQATSHLHIYICSYLVKYLSVYAFLIINHIHFVFLICCNLHCLNCFKIWKT